MKAFMDKDFLLSTETAQELYHNFAAQVPVRRNRRRSVEPVQCQIAGRFHECKKPD